MLLITHTQKKPASQLGDLNKLLQKELFEILNTERQTFTVTQKFTLN